LGVLEADAEVDLEPLLIGLRSTNETVVFWSVTALGRLPRSAGLAADDLARIVLDHPALASRQAAIVALAVLAPSAARTRTTLQAALQDSSPFVRREALQALIEVPNQAEEDLERIRVCASDPDEAVRDWSTIALRNIAARRN
jgi:HEAT repeat protein